LHHLAQLSAAAAVGGSENHQRGSGRICQPVIKIELTEAVELEFGRLKQACRHNSLEISGRDDNLHQNEDTGQESRVAAANVCRTGETRCRDVFRRQTPKAM
ncbi:MAG: hypothetical protein WBM84_16135, partial [Sedimenticolaceae bacterium]